jgi:hypothetical protein
MRIILLFPIAALVFAQTTKYPGAIDNDSSLFVVADNVQSSLTAAMAVGDTTAAVASATGFAANMIITICDTQTNTGKCTAWEHMLVTGVSGNSLTVTRAFAGTIARSHSSGRLVSVLIDAAHQKVLKDAVIAIENALGSNLSNVNSVNASLYNFSPQQPGGTLTGGIVNAVNMNPCPLGVSGGDAGHNLYISAGAGSPETVLITGGSCASGASSGTVIFTPSNTHSGAWTIASASGGLQEAICSLSPGGEVVVNADLTLRANVTSCGKIAVSVSKKEGSIISGAFTILGSNSVINPPYMNYISSGSTTIGNPAVSILDAGNGINWGGMTSGRNYTSQILDIGNFPDNLRWGQPSGPPVVFGVDASIDLLGSGFNGLVAPLAAHVRNGTGSGVGLLTTCYNGNNGGGCWGANLNVVGNMTGSAARIWGQENDLNTQSPPAPAPASVIGYSAVMAGMNQATGRHSGFAAELADVPPHNWAKFKAAFESYNGAATYGLSVGLAEWVEGSGTLAGLPAPSAGNTNAVYWCSNCNVATPCTSGGAGAYARSSGASWACFSTGVSSQSIGFFGLTGTTNTSGAIAMSGNGDLLISAGSGAATVLQAGGSTKFGFSGLGDIQLVGRNLASLGASANASLTWCTDCKNVGDGATVAAGCVGSGTGAVAIRENGLWRCF